MIVVDSSVIVAILRRESDAQTWIEILDRTSKALMSVVSFVETNMVICGRRSDPDPHEVTSLLKALRIDIAPVTRKQGETAVAAFLCYGKGRHRASLNLADCFSYALAKVQRAPLLYKGNDFAVTDLTPIPHSQ
jgi:ribonuclease VapC